MAFFRTSKLKLKPLDAGSSPDSFSRRTALREITSIDDRYLICEVTGLHGDESNENGDHFRWTELLRKRDDGLHVFQTWKDCPNLTNHDHRCVVGTILDVWPVREEKAINMLLGVDKVKHPELAKAVRAGKITEVSMGAVVGHSLCSKCGNLATCEQEWCSCLSPTGKNLKGRTDPETGYFIYEDNRDVTGQEVSWITFGKAADPKAVAKEVFASKHEEEHMGSIGQRSGAGQPISAERALEANAPVVSSARRSAAGGITSGGMDRGTLQAQVLAQVSAKLKADASKAYRTPATALAAIEKGLLDKKSSLDLIHQFGLCSQSDAENLSVREALAMLRGGQKAPSKDEPDEIEELVNEQATDAPPKKQEKDEEEETPPEPKDEKPDEKKPPKKKEEKTVDPQAVKDVVKELENAVGDALDLQEEHEASEDEVLESVEEVIQELKDTVGLPKKKDKKAGPEKAIPEKKEKGPLPGMKDEKPPGILPEMATKLPPVPALPKLSYLASLNRNPTEPLRSSWTVLRGRQPVFTVTAVRAFGAQATEHLQEFLDADYGMELVKILDAKGLRKTLDSCYGGGKYCTLLLTQAQMQDLETAETPNLVMDDEMVQKLKSPDEGMPSLVTFLAEVLAPVIHYSTDLTPQAVVAALEKAFSDDKSKGAFLGMLQEKVSEHGGEGKGEDKAPMEPDSPGGGASTGSGSSSTARLIPTQLLTEAQLVINRLEKDVEVLEAENTQMKDALKKEITARRDREYQERIRARAVRAKDLVTRKIAIRVIEADAVEQEVLNLAKMTDEAFVEEAEKVAKWEKEFRTAASQTPRDDGFKVTASTIPTQEIEGPVSIGPNGKSLGGSNFPWTGIPRAKPGQTRLGE